MNIEDRFNVARLRAHRVWVAGGRSGDGQFIARGERFQRARIHGLMLDYAVFESCDLVEAHIEYSTLEHAALTDCKATDGSFYNGRFSHATILRSEFQRTNLRDCWFTDANLADCVFDGANLDLGNLVRSTVVQCKFAGARLADTQLDHGRFERCDFRGATLNDTAYGTQFIDCDFRGANLQGLKLRDTHFIRCRFAGVIGTPTIEGAVELTDADLSSEEAFEGPSSTDELRRTWGL